MSTTPLVVIYYRVSTAEQAERGFSLEHQRDACLRYAESKGLKVVKEFHDDGFSAKTANRNGLKEMMKYCAEEKSKVVAVIVYKVDRLSRDVGDYANLKTQLNQSGVRLLSVSENIDDTPAGKFMGNMMATMAQWDNDVRSERVTAGMKKCIESGRWPFKAPIGYLNYIGPSGQKKIIVDEDRARLISFIFSEFATGLYSEENIRQRVNKLGLRTFAGKEVSPQFIHKILIDRFYIGIMTMNGQLYKGTHKPLTTVEIFEACQKQLRRYDKSMNLSLSRINEHFPLRHFVHCGICSRPLTASFSTGKSGRRFPYYRCYNKKCSSPRSVAKHPFEGEFVEYLKSITPHRKYLNAFRSVVVDVWENKYKQSNVNRESWQAKLAQLSHDKQRVIDLVKKGIIEDDDAKQDIDKIKAEIMQTEMKLGQVNETVFDVKAALDHCFDFILNISTYWEQGTYEQKTKIQSSIFSKNPSYFYPKFETPEFSLIFGQKRDLAHAKSLLVHLYQSARTFFQSGGVDYTPLKQNPPKPSKRT